MDIAKEMENVVNYGSKVVVDMAKVTVNSIKDETAAVKATSIMDRRLL